MKITNKTVAEAAEYVSDYLSKQLPKGFAYHSFSHTLSVVNAADMLCRETRVSKRERKILLVAAWFHDIGYTKQINEHEKAGTLIASQFLRNKKVNEKEIAIINACILATQVPQRPKNKLEQILCDADLLYLGETNFAKQSNELRKEWAATIHKIYTDREWLELNIQFLKAHKFQLQYCRAQFDNGKLNNMEMLLTKLKEVANLNIPGNIAA
jgi:predicted metal-dependent HD superfamily phosphohydrolase